MALITTIDEFGVRKTTITFDFEAFERWKAERAAWKRKRYAENPQLRAEAVARAAASRKRKLTSITSENPL